MILVSEALADTWFFEKELQTSGFRKIAGVDEAGRGPLAGPVVAAACILPEGLVIDGLDDSKKLSPSLRSKIFRFLSSHPDVMIGVGISSPQEIDDINILQATLAAMKRAVSNLVHIPDYVLVDGSILPKWAFPSRAVVKGDSLSASISAASVVAKETRDVLMNELDKQYPGYGFAKHKGYGTKAHMQAIASLGPCPIHRQSFEPLKSKCSLLTKETSVLCDSSLLLLPRYIDSQSYSL